MKSLVLLAALLIASPALAQSNAPAPNPPATNAPASVSQPSQPIHDPWDDVPATVPYKNVADAIKDSARPGEPSPLNPSCEGMTGEQCVRAAEKPQP